MFEEKYSKESAKEYVQKQADELNGKYNKLIEDVQALVDKTLDYFRSKKQ